MKNFVLITSLVAALTFGAAPATSTPKHHHHHRDHLARTARGAYATQPQIACTVVGCMPVPRGCHPEMGYTPDGTPTGFDVAVCGNYTLYGLHR